MSRFKDPMDCGIYSITAPSGNQYIGSSLNIPHRFYEHRRELDRQEHCNKALQNAWNKYNGELEFKKILICEPKDLLFYEQLILDSFKPEYNICPIAGNTSGVILTEEHKAKISEKASLYRHSEESKEKIRRALKAYKRTPEHQANLTKSCQGRKCKPASEERKRKIGIANRKRWAERKEKLACLSK